MFRHVYASDIAVAEHKKAEKIVGDLFDYYLEYPEEMSGEFQALLDDRDPVRQVVCDYIACMTDRFAVAKYKTLFIPQDGRFFEGLSRNHFGYRLKKILILG